MLASVVSDVLVIATEPGEHARLAVLGARYGQHVLCEKPLTLTRQQHQLVVSAFEGRPELGLVSVHQYQYAPTWISVSRWGRLADRFAIPFSIVVDVQRDGIDRHAVSSWRAALEPSGGMLADHGVHFLALGWAISEKLEVLAAWRTWDRAGNEWSIAKVRVGPGQLEIRVCATAPARRTVVNFSVGHAAFNWTDDTALLAMRGRAGHPRRVGALSSRTYVDELYFPFYRDVIVNLGDASWRGCRKAEALAISDVLIALLEGTTSRIEPS